MKHSLKIIPEGKVNEVFSLEVQKWAEEVIGKTRAGMTTDRISIYLWENEKDFQEFDTREKAELGVATGGGF